MKKHKISSYVSEVLGYLRLKISDFFLTSFENSLTYNISRPHDGNRSPLAGTTTPPMPFPTLSSLLTKSAVSESASQMASTRSSLSLPISMPEAHHQLSELKVQAMVLVMDVGVVGHSKRDLWCHCEERLGVITL